MDGAAGVGVPARRRSGRGIERGEPVPGVAPFTVTNAPPVYTRLLATSTAIGLTVDASSDSTRSACRS